MNESILREAVESRVGTGKALDYESVEAMYEHVLRIADATGGKSGMFGISFSDLIPYLKKYLGKKAAKAVEAKAKAFNDRFKK